jgi:hypothetical protein
LSALAVLVHVVHLSPSSLQSDGLRLATGLVEVANCDGASADRSIAKIVIEENTVRSPLTAHCHFPRSA